MKAVGLSKPLTDADLVEWEELVYDSCTLCGRCSMVCPVGNDITAMIRKLREGMVAAGHVPETMKAAAVKAMTGISPIGVGLVALKKQIEKQSKETGIPIELDKEGAEFLVILSSMEIIGFPEILGALAKLFKQAGATWTIASDAYEGTNIGIQIGSKDVAKALVQRVVTAAERLQVKTVISPECGHAYQAIRWEGPNLIGRPYGFKVIHIVELLDQWVKEGRIRTKGKHADRVSFHDPCQISRRGGLDAPARRLLAGVAADVVEQPESGAMGWCCGGGGGVSANHRAEELRLKVFTAKKRQIEAVAPRQLVTACANCRNVMEEAIDHYQMDLIAEHLEDDAP
jgi:Fe-S oxidoreductase